MDHDNTAAIQAARDNAILALQDLIFHTRRASRLWARWKSTVERYYEVLGQAGYYATDHQSRTVLNGALSAAVDKVRQKDFAEGDEDLGAWAHAIAELSQAIRAVSGLASVIADRTTITIEANELLNLLSLAKRTGELLRKAEEVNRRNICPGGTPIIPPELPPDGSPGPPPL